MLCLVRAQLCNDHNIMIRVNWALETDEPISLHLLGGDALVRGARIAGGGDLERTPDPW